MRAGHRNPPATARGGAARTAVRRLLTWRAIIARWHHQFHAFPRCYASALPPWIPLVAAIDQGAHGRRARAPEPPGIDLVVPAIAALAARGDEDGDGACVGVAAGPHGRD